MLSLSPLTVASVCRVGDSLQLTCIAPVRSLRWSILQVNDQGTLVGVTNSVLIDGSDDNQRKQSKVASTILIYMRISTSGASPLISTLSINSVSNSLNGTVVRCSDVTNPMISASTIIQIANISQISELTKLLIIVVA